MQRGRADVARHELVRKMRQLRDAARDSVCVPERGYPGRPADYTYSLRETCTPLDPAAREARRRARKASQQVPTPAATRREIAHIERVLHDHYGDVMPSSEGPIQPLVLRRPLELMLDPKERLAEPDPEKRYERIAKRYRAQNREPPGRFTVLELAMVALRASIGVVQPWHPPSGNSSTRGG